MPGTKKVAPLDPASYEAIREAVAVGDTLVGYERRNGLRGLYAEFYAAERELGLAADIAPSLFEADGTPKAKRLGPAILAARASGVRWSRIAVYLDLSEKEVRAAAEKSGLAEDHYVGLGRRYGREGTAVRKARAKK
jgi:hypothetical protein